MDRTWGTESVPAGSQGESRLDRDGGHQMISRP